MTARVNEAEVALTPNQGRHCRQMLSVFKTSLVCFHDKLATVFKTKLASFQYLFCFNIACRLNVMKYAQKQTVFCSKKTVTHPDTRSSGTAGGGASMFGSGLYADRPPSDSH